MSEEGPDLALGLNWEEQAACELVGSWLHRIGAGWPDGLSSVKGDAGALWDRFDRDIGVAFAAQSWPMLHTAFAEFRKGAVPILREWRRQQQTGAGPFVQASG